MVIEAGLPFDGVAAQLASLRGAVVATVILQTLVLVRMPVPSPVSIRRTHDGRSGFLARGLFLTAVWGGVIPVAVSVFPPLYRHLLPISLLPEGVAPWLGGGLLAGGNVVLLLAVVALRRHTGFGANGESERLLTRGIYGLLRHPIVAGMGAVYAGCLLIWPTLWGVAGILAFCIHQYRCLEAEEALLDQRFGETYRRYRDRVGRFWLRRRFVPSRDPRRHD